LSFLLCSFSLQSLSFGFLLRLLLLVQDFSIFAPSIRDLDLSVRLVLRFEIIEVAQGSCQLCPLFQVVDSLPGQIASEVLLSHHGSIVLPVEDAASQLVSHLIAADEFLYVLCRLSSSLQDGADSEPCDEAASKSLDFTSCLSVHQAGLLLLHFP